MKSDQVFSCVSLIFEHFLLNAWCFGVTGNPRDPRGCWPGRSDIFGRKVTSRAEELLGTYSYRASAINGKYTFRSVLTVIIAGFCATPRLDENTLG